MTPVLPSPMQMQCSTYLALRYYHLAKQTYEILPIKLYIHIYCYKTKSYVHRNIFNVYIFHFQLDSIGISIHYGFHWCIHTYLQYCKENIPIVCQCAYSVHFCKPVLEVNCFVYTIAVFLFLHMGFRTPTKSK